MEQTTVRPLSPAEQGEKKKAHPVRFHNSRETTFGRPREFMENQFVYAVVSARARGLSLGINLNPDKRCNFNCVYCEVHRNGDPPRTLDVEVMAAELKRMLAFVRGGRMRELPAYRVLPDELLQLRHVALSGDGEPTLAPKFAEALQAVIHVRALSGYPFFKLVLITNGTGLHLPQVQAGLKHLTRSDELWIKLDGGTQAYLNRVNRSDVPLEQILANISLVGRQRPVVIQSLFPALGEEEPSVEEIEQYAERLRELKNEGAEISLVQVYSAARPAVNSTCQHLPLKVLSRIVQTVRQTTGLKAEVF